MGMPTAMMSTHEVAKYLNIHPSTLYRLLSRGEGPPSFKVGSDHRFRKEAVDAWILEMEGGKGSEGAAK